MFRRLNSRLLASYLLVIVAALGVIGFVLVGISSLPQVRLTPTINRLNTQATTLYPIVERLTLTRAGIAQLDERLTEFAADVDGRILLVDTDRQTVIFDSGGGWLDLTMSLRDRPINVSVQNRTVQISRYRAPDNSDWVLYAVPLSNVRDAAIVFAAPEAPRLQLFRETFARPILASAVIALAVSLLLATVISRSVAQPLLRMAAAAGAIAQGNYDQTLPLNGPEEVQRVAGDFNRMAERVKATQQAQRDFLANVSHDLKTPLTSIQGWSQALLDGTLSEPDEVARAAQVIQDESARMTRLVQQLLDLAKLESGQMTLRREPVALTALLERVRDNLALRADSAEIDLTFDLQPAVTLFADADRLTQVFTNLLDNALAHTPHGGSVRVGLRTAAEKAVVQVHDSGRGIPPDQLERIFERFYQVDRSRARSERRSGTGLGLSIAHQLVTAHGGTLTVTSQVGLGSTFTVHLPLTSPPTSR